MALTQDKVEEFTRVLENVLLEELQNSREFGDPGWFISNKEYDVAFDVPDVESDLRGPKYEPLLNLHITDPDTKQTDTLSFRVRVELLRHTENS